MKLRIITVGKKHDTWVKEGIEQFSKRLRPPFDVEFTIVANASRPTHARNEESEKILRLIGQEDWVILLDERGRNLSSQELSEHLLAHINKQIVIVIGGAYGVNDAVRTRANFTWSLSRLVFPHQLVRLILIEQLYRAQEISRGTAYHHH